MIFDWFISDNCEVFESTDVHFWIRDRQHDIISLSCGYFVLSWTKERVLSQIQMKDE